MGNVIFKGVVVDSDFQPIKKIVIAPVSINSKSYQSRAYKNRRGAFVNYEEEIGVKYEIRAKGYISTTYVVDNDIEIKQNTFFLKPISNKTSFLALKAKKFKGVFNVMCNKIRYGLFVNLGV